MLKTTKVCSSLPVPQLDNILITAGSTQSRERERLIHFPLFCPSSTKRWIRFHLIYTIHFLERQMYCSLTVSTSAPILSMLKLWHSYPRVFLDKATSSNPYCLTYLISFAIFYFSFTSNPPDVRLSECCRLLFCYWCLFLCHQGPTGPPGMMGTLGDMGPKVSLITCQTCVSAALLCC